MIQMLYFDDFTDGLEWQSQGRTVTEADICSFAQLTGDFNPLHIDAEYAKDTLFEQRVAHGLLGLSIDAGLSMSTVKMAVIAFLGLNWKFKKPIFIGDTIRSRTHLKSKRSLGDDRGIVVLTKELLNQDDEVTQSGEFQLMVSKAS